MYWSVQLNCSSCGHSWNELIQKEHRGQEFDCPSCLGEGTCTEQIMAPAILGTTTKNGDPSGALVDGQRAKSESWKRMAEASKLESKAANMAFKDRKEINKEIKKLKEVKK